MPTGQVGKVSPPPPTPQKMRRGTQTEVTAASVTASHLPPPMKEFTYEPSKGVDDDDDMMSTMTMIISLRMKLGSTVGKMSVL